MCIIVYDRAGGLVTEEQVRNMYTRNSDGVGIIPLEEARLAPVKIGKPSSADEVVALWQQYKDKPYSMHLRLKTHGDIDKENCHPYRLFDDSDDAWLFHNGILSVVEQEDKAKSDTWHFIDYFLKPMGPKLLDHLQCPNFRATLGKMIGSTNKFLIVSTKGTFIINEKSGTYRNDNQLWLSNLHSVDTTTWTPSKTNYNTSYTYGSTRPATTTKPKTFGKTAIGFFDIPSNPFLPLFLEGMTLNEIAAALRYCSGPLLDAMHKHYKLEVGAPTNLQELRNRALLIYCKIAEVGQE